MIDEDTPIYCEVEDQTWRDLFAVRAVGSMMISMTTRPTGATYRLVLDDLTECEAGIHEIPTWFDAMVLLFAAMHPGSPWLLAWVERE